VALLAFFACALVTNLEALSRSREPAGHQGAQAIVQALNNRTTPNDCIAVQSWDDPTMRLVDEHPFSLLNKNRFAYYVVVLYGTAQPKHWLRQLAERIQTAWRKGGRAWISNRFHAGVPDPSWGWVEGDEPRIRWADFHTFFEKLDRGDTFGGTLVDSLRSCAPRRINCCSLRRLRPARVTAIRVDSGDLLSVGR
jgi:hypothetical protein